MTSPETLATLYTVPPEIIYRSDRDAEGRCVGAWKLRFGARNFSYKMFHHASFCRFFAAKPIDLSQIFTLSNRFPVQNAVWTPLPQLNSF